MRGTIPLGQTELAYERGGSYRASLEPIILKVVRYTAKQVICQSGMVEIRFNLDNGSERGGHYGSHAYVVDAKVLDRIAQSELDGRLSSSARQLAELANKLASQDRRRMKAHAIEARLQTVLLAVSTIERMLKIEPEEER